MSRQPTRPVISFFVPKTKWGRWSGKPDWHPDVAQASVWIRSYQLAPYLTELGYHVTCNQTDPLPDVGIFLRRYNFPNVTLARQIKAHGGKVIVDIVVNYFESRQATSLKYGGAAPELVESFLNLVSLADQVWAVSPFLQSQAACVHPSAYFVSDSVDPAHFCIARHISSQVKKPLVLGWSGTAAKAHALEEIAALLQAHILKKEVQVLLISNDKPRLSFPFTFEKWRYSTFPKHIARCDVCIAPRRVDNNYDRGHSLFKIGVFMAAGIPALAGPVPAYSLLLADHLAGEICDTKAAWKMHLERYLSDPMLRQSAGAYAQEKMKPYLTPNVAVQVDQLLRKIL